jgi:hypothetical protein
MATTITETRPRIEAREAGRSAVGEQIVAGAIAGMIGAVLMGLWAMISMAIKGMGFWLPMDLIDGIWAGPMVILGGAGYALGGVVTHMIFAAMTGAAFGVILPRGIGWGGALISGLLYGALIWVVMTFAGLPLVNSTMSARVSLVQANFFWEHLLYGFGLSLTPVLMRSFARTSHPSTAAR